MKRVPHTDPAYTSHVPQRVLPSRKEPRAPIVEPGWNCWRVEHASRLGYVVDGEAYFRAFREAVAQAQRSVLILAWDIDSRIRLAREGNGDGLPDSLADFLHAVVARRPG